MYIIFNYYEILRLKDVGRYIIILLMMSSYFNQLPGEQVLWLIYYTDLTEGWPVGASLIREAITRAILPLAYKRNTKLMYIHTWIFPCVALWGRESGNVAYSGFNATEWPLIRSVYNIDQWFIHASNRGLKYEGGGWDKYRHICVYIYVYRPTLVLGNTLK